MEFRVEKVGYEKETESRIINGDVLDWFIVLNPLVSSLLLYIFATLPIITHCARVNITIYFILDSRKKSSCPRKHSPYI